MTGAVRVRAPGKAMLVGEYAVLDGGPAVVAAVDCHATATLSSTAAPASPFIAHALRQCRAALGRQDLPVPVVDTAAFQLGGRKLGLGSSAAATVAAVGALYCHRGLSLDQHRAEIEAVAARAHDAAQQARGSGADIRAATWGGLRVLNGATPASRLPLRLRFVATGKSASTAELIARYRAAGAGARGATGDMTAAAQEFVAAWEAADAYRLVDAVETAFAAFLGLGHALGHSLVTEEHAAVRAAARRVGGTGKPSGAGGGDLAVAFLPDDPEAEAAFRAELAHNLLLLPVQVSALGVHRYDQRNGDE